jgi:hypothetical protein
VRQSTEGKVWRKGGSYLLRAASLPLLDSMLVSLERTYWLVLGSIV